MRQAKATAHTTEDFFTVPELAGYLRMNRATIYKMVTNGEMPGFRVGHQWRIKKSSINTWIEKQESAPKKSSAKNRFATFNKSGVQA